MFRPEGQNSKEKPNLIEGTKDTREHCTLGVQRAS